MSRLKGQTLVFGFVAALIVCEGCLPGWTQMSPADAYRIESEQCAKKPGDEAWKCQNGVDHKYGQYNAEGGYPSPGKGHFCTPTDCH